MNPQHMAQLLGANPESPADLVRMMQLLLHSIGAGTALMLITVWGSSRVAARFQDPEEHAPGGPAEIVLSSANVLFLCFGMTGVMLLVNNNLARAFAIGAAIALVRFRIKVTSKTLSMALFYGVLTGMACGVDRVELAWGIAGVFGILQVLVLAMAGIADRGKRRP